MGFNVKVGQNLDENLHIFDSALKNVSNVSIPIISKPYKYNINIIAISTFSNGTYLIVDPNSRVFLSITKEAKGGRSSHAVSSI